MKDNITSCRCSVGSTLEQGGAQLHPVFGFAPPVWNDAIITVTVNNISLLRLFILFKTDE